MTQFPYDEFAKNYLTQLLSSIGKVNSSLKLATEIKEIDVYYTHGSQGVTEEQKQQILGLLGRFATKPAVFEPFRNAATVDDVRSCANKLFDIFAEIKRTAKSENTKVVESELPLLWILSPTASKPLLKGFSATRSGRVDAVDARCLFLRYTLENGDCRNTPTTTYRRNAVAKGIG
jgi:hypothetical protein